ncbi:MAG: hypothetical protein A2033_03910 [Bacteroidetes bacterium GWA2_31_9]|nr:MAG: hypothetical protein A2033_03910 [Bacteroidetes bacterium GWA2_31_9]
MPKTKKQFNSILRKTIVFSLFLISTIIVLLLYPKEGKFRYEFHKGKPWMHENLISPFDFAILKLPIELDEEKDSLNNNFKKFYKIDNQVYISEINKFQKDFELKWGEHLTKYYNISFINNGILSNSKLLAKKKKYYTFCYNILDYIFSQGIIEEEVYPSNKFSEQLMLIRNNNIAESVVRSDIFTINTAINYITIKLTKPSDSLTYASRIEKDFFGSIDLNKYLVANVFFDDETTKKLKQSLIDGISLTRGMIQEGQKIITKGEIVNQDKYRILNSLKKEYEASIGGTENFYMISLGQLILIISTFLILFFFLKNFRKDIIKNLLKISFLLMLILIFVAITSLTIKINIIHHYLIPYALIPIIVRTFYDSRLAQFILLVTVLLIAFITPNPFEFVYLQLITGTIAVFSLATVQRRSQLFLTSLIIFLTYSFLYLGISIMQEGNLENIYWKNFVWFAGNGLLLLSSYPLIYIFEKLFGFLSDVTLMELSNTNHPLLRKLAQEAPGTFHHSLQVANIAEDVAFHIGGNSLLVRVGAMYHDLGKVSNPRFFIENQRLEINPHDEIDYEESAKIIINHVTEGVNLARKYNIPNQIIDFMRTHHGNMKVLYFYRSYMNKYPNKEVDINKFTYPGVSPFTKEHAILMMSDSVEAASRSLKEVSEESITALIDRVIDYQIKEKQYENSDITFRDISKAKTVLKQKLLNIYHVRIEYPDEKK